MSLVLSCLLPYAGCGKGRPATMQVSGRVTYQGQPVPEGSIMFHPEKGRPALGSIGPDGSYTLTTFDQGDGAAPGKYRVTIDARAAAANAPRSFQEELGGNSPTSIGVKWLAPEKYSRLETSNLTAEVKPGQNVINFDLP